jgi:hypothetical protein
VRRREVVVVHAFQTVLVVILPFFRIREDFVGGIDFFEFVFVTPFVGMVSLR